MLHALDRRGKDFGGAHSGTGGGLFGVNGLAEDIQEALTLICPGRVDRQIAERGLAGQFRRYEGVQWEPDGACKHAPYDG